MPKYQISASDYGSPQDPPDQPPEPPNDDDPIDPPEQSAEPSAEGADKPGEEPPQEEISHADYHESGQPHISADMFVSSHRTPRDQLAGFRFWANQEMPQLKLTIAQWEEHLLKFNQRPVR